jgi:hypothetical protein
MIIDSPIISGSYSASGSLNQFGNVVISGSLTVTGSIIGTASFASTASYLSGYVSPFPFTGSAIISGSLAVTGSLFVTGSQTFIGTKTITGSVFISGSKTVIGTNTVTGSMLISGSLDVNGPITATTLIVQTITASQEYSSGSNVFGNSLANTQILTGSVSITGSLAVNGSNAVLTNQTSSMSASYALNATSASSAISSSFANTAGSLVTTSNYQMASLGVGTAPVAPFKGNFYGQVIVQNGINNATGQQSLIFAYPGITNNLTHSIWSGHDASVANYNKLDFYIGKTSGLAAVNVLSLRSSQPVLIGSDTGLGLTVSGSTVISGSLTSTTGITGSLLGTSSFANNATSASYALTASFSLNVPVTASYANNANSASYALSSSFATTASYLSGYVSPFPFTGSAIISGSLTVTGSANLPNITGSLQGTASYAVTASNAVTASYLSGYVSPFPFTGSAIISGSLAVTGSLTITGSNTLIGTKTITGSVFISGSKNIIGTNTVTGSMLISGSTGISGSLTVNSLSGSGVRYLVADESGSITAQSASAALKSTQAFTSTAGQTTFSVTNGYSTGYVDVFINGSKLSTAEFTDTSGTNIVLATGSFVNDTVEVVKYTPAAGVTNNVLRQLTTLTGSAGQTVFSASYTPGLLDIFYNGSRLSPSDYTANNGTYFTLATGSAANDILDVLVYSYQVGAFSGIGGAGLANQLSFFNTTSSISGSTNLTYNGSTLTLVGNKVITGSVFISGSKTIIGTNTITGSLFVTGSQTFIGTKTITGSVFISGSKTVIGNNTVSGSMSISGSLDVNGTITATTLVVQTINVTQSYSSGSNIFGNNISNTQAFTGSVLVTGSVNVNSGSFYIGSNNQIGVNNNSPSSQFVVGKIGNNATLELNLNNVGYSRIFSYDRGATASTNLILQDPGGYVGIGTTAPSSSLHIYGSTYFGSRLILERTAGAIGRYSMGVSTANNQFDITDEAQGNLTRFSINSSGSVGIGTTSPTGTYSKLTVAGGIQITDDNNAKLEIGRYSSGALYSYIKIGTNSNGLRITNAADSIDLFTFTNSGNVGIGTTPSSWSSPFVAIQGGTYGQHIGFQTNGPDIKIGTNNYYNSGYIYTVSSNGAAQLNIGGNSGFQFNVAPSGTAGNAVTFTTAMAITSAGNVSIGNGTYNPTLIFNSGGATSYYGIIKTDNDVDFLQLSGGSVVAYNNAATISLTGANRYGTYTAGMLNLSAGNATNNTTYGYIQFSTANTLRMQISYNGAIGTTSGGTNIYNPSDLRLKKNITALTYGLSEILALKPSKFNWKDGFSQSEADKDMLGFIAQDIQSVIPEAVESFGQTVTVKTGDHDYSVENPLRVNEKFIIPVLVKAIQELQEKLERNNIN